jgi:hypothetical protein
LEGFVGASLATFCFLAGHGAMKVVNFHAREPVAGGLLRFGKVLVSTLYTKL